MATEIELKILLDAKGATALRRVPLLAGKAGQRQTLVARYFDTEDGRLGHNRIALRVRREGRAWVQTVKAGRESIAGLSSVMEVSCPAPQGRLALDAIPDAGLHAAILEAVGDGVLAVRFETRIRRQTFRLASPLGGLVELAIDTGDIIAGEAAAPLIEAELELIEGDPRDIYAIAAALFPQGPLRFSRRSKAARGSALARGEPAVHPLPPIVHASPVTLDPAMTVETAARDILRACLDQIAANAAATVASDAAEGPHQLRVGLRRLRTALLLLRPVLGGPAADALDSEARDLATVVGDLRDLDVLIGEIVTPLAGADAGFPPLLDALAARRAMVRQAVEARLRDRRTVGFVLDLGAFVEARGWLRPADFEQSAALAAPVSGLAVAALEKRWHQAAKRARGIATLEEEARHDLRKALKKLRYAVEFTASLWPEKKVAPFLRALKGLQEDFGALQDLAMARALLTAPGAPAADHPAAQRAAGYVLGHRAAEAERVWQHAQADWKALRRVERYWR